MNKRLARAPPKYTLGGGVLRGETVVQLFAAMLWSHQSMEYSSYTQNSVYLSFGSHNDYTSINTKGYCSRPSFSPINQQKQEKIEETEGSNIYLKPCTVSVL